MNKVIPNWVTEKLDKSPEIEKGNGGGIYRFKPTDTVGDATYIYAFSEGYDIAREKFKE